MKCRFVLSVWEWERRYPIGGWTGQRREMSDPPHFASRSGSLDAQGLDAVEANLTATAAAAHASCSLTAESSWSLVISDKTDRDGWAYGLDHRQGEFSSVFDERWSWIRRRQYSRRGLADESFLTSGLGSLSSYIQVEGPATPRTPTPATPCSDVEPVFGGNAHVKRPKIRTRSFPESSSDDSDDTADDLVPEPSQNVRSRAPPPKLQIPTLKLDGMKRIESPPPPGAGILSESGSRLTPRLLQHNQRQHVAVVLTPRDVTPRQGGLSAPNSARSTATEVTWVKDSDAHVCSSCSSKFTVFVRRHHCRMCGQVFCSQCCKIDAEHGKMRVCIHCLAEEAARVLEEQQVADELAEMERQLQHHENARAFVYSATLELEVKLRLELCAERTNEFNELVMVERGERLALLTVEELQSLPPVEPLELSGMFSESWRSALRGKLFLSMGPLRCRAKGTVKAVDGFFTVSYNGMDPISVVATAAPDLPTKQPKEVEISLDGESSVLVVSVSLEASRRGSLFQRRGSRPAAPAAFTSDVDLVATLLQQHQQNLTSSAFILTSVVSGTSLLSFPSAGGLIYETALRYRFEPTIVGPPTASGAQSEGKRPAANDLSGALLEVIQFRTKRLELDRNLDYSRLVSDERASFSLLVQQCIKATGIAHKLSARRTKQRELAPVVQKIFAVACKSLANYVVHIWYAQTVRNTQARHLARAKLALEEKARKQAEALLVHQQCLEGPKRIVVVVASAPGDTPPVSSGTGTVTAISSPASPVSHQTDAHDTGVQRVERSRTPAAAAPSTISIDRLFDVPSHKTPPHKAKQSKCCSLM